MYGALSELKEKNEMISNSSEKWKWKLFNFELFVCVMYAIANGDAMWRDLFNAQRIQCVQCFQSFQIAAISCNIVCTL